MRFSRWSLASSSSEPIGSSPPPRPWRNFIGLFRNPLARQRKDQVKSEAEGENGEIENIGQEPSSPRPFSSYGSRSSYYSSSSSYGMPSTSSTFNRNNSMSTVDPVTPITPKSMSSARWSMYAGSSPSSPPPQPQSEAAAEEHSLVLTLTSKYPTGAAAELYVPEDCSFPAAQQRMQRRLSIRPQSRNGVGLARPTRFSSTRDRDKAKRASVNF